MHQNETAATEGDSQRGFLGPDGDLTATFLDDPCLLARALQRTYLLQHLHQKPILLRSLHFGQIPTCGGRQTRQSTAGISITSQGRSGCLNNGVFGGYIGCTRVQAGTGSKKSLESLNAKAELVVQRQLGGISVRSAWTAPLSGKVGLRESVGLLALLGRRQIGILHFAHGWYTTSDAMGQ